MCSLSALQHPLHYPPDCFEVSPTFIAFMSWPLSLNSTAAETDGGGESRNKLHTHSQALSLLTNHTTLQQYVQTSQSGRRKGHWHVKVKHPHWPGIKFVQLKETPPRIWFKQRSDGTFISGYRNPLPELTLGKKCFVLYLWNPTFRFRVHRDYWRILLGVNCVMDAKHTSLKITKNTVRSPPLHCCLSLLTVCV